MSHSYTAGVRVENRDAEWRIKCVDRTTDGGELLTCEGLSKLVRGRQATHRPNRTHHRLPTPILQTQSLRRLCSGLGIFRRPNPVSLYERAMPATIIG